eukprot:12715898-Heterocapsa_arctica.AAC.1
MTLRRAQHVYPIPVPTKRTNIMLYRSSTIVNNYVCSCENNMTLRRAQRFYPIPVSENKNIRTSHVKEVAEYAVNYSIKG